MSLSRRDFLSSMGGLAALIATCPFKAMAATGKRYGVIGTVIIGDGSGPLHDHAVLINHDRIEAILPASEVKDRQLISISGATILPGIINSHCHRIYSREDRYQRYLQHGVTSIGDTASPLAALPRLLQSPAGKTATAAIAGPMLCPSGGYPLPIHSADNGMVITSPAAGREAVRRLADQGTTMVKIAFEPGVNSTPWPLFDGTTASAICDEARKLGQTIRCHVEDFSGLESALNAGVHTVEHVPYRWIKDGSHRDILTNGKLISEYRILLDRMAQENVIMTPTLDVFSRSMWDGPRLYEPVRYFNDIGGRIALGNDHPYRRTEAGMPSKEVELLGKAGLSPLQIVTAGTQNSARACGYVDRGTLAPGTKADILVIKGNPLEKITLFGSCAMIIKDGAIISQSL